jgi:hypothetical protein
MSRTLGPWARAVLELARVVFAVHGGSTAVARAGYGSGMEKRGERIGVSRDKRRLIVASYHVQHVQRDKGKLAPAASCLGVGATATAASHTTPTTALRIILQGDPITASSR